MGIVLPMLMICLGISRAEPNGLGVVGNGLVVLTREIVGNAPIAIPLDMSRGEPDCLVEIRDGLVL